MKRSLNLMTERSRKREQMRRCLRLWSRVVVGALVVLIVLGAAKWWACSTEEQRQASAEAEYEPIRQIKIENSRLKKQIASLQSTERIPLALKDHQPLLGLIGLATQAVAEQNSSVYLKQMDIERDLLLTEAVSKSELSFSLEGIGLANDSVTQLADTLRKIGPFTNVELEASAAQPTGLQKHHVFSIECTN